jgi:hypothetical protein
MGINQTIRRTNLREGEMADIHSSSPAEGRRWKTRGGSDPGIIYVLGFIGALIYFIQQAATFVEGLLGVLKAIVWPALVVYKVLEFFGL